MYNLAENTEILAKLNFNNFTNVGLLMTNEGTLESQNHGEIVFGHLAGVKGTYKNKLSVQGKQTVGF